MKQDAIWQRVEPASTSCFDRAAVRGALLILMGLAMVLACVTVPARPAAASEAEIPYAGMDDGGLFLPSETPGYVVPATTVDTGVVIDVSGLVARATVTQRFVNPTDAWVEGVYVFPLPETAAVDRLRMVIGDRTVEGEVQEREAAQHAYETAAAAGQQASLVSQERPNIFTNAVANIPPQGEITVEIAYQQTLAFDQGAFSLRFPSVVLPRYIPGNQPIAGEPGHGWSFNTTQVPDAERITPPVAAPASQPINPLQLTVNLNAGFPLASAYSPTHDLTITEHPDGRLTLALADSQAWTDRDFELVWEPAPRAAPSAGVFSERRDDGDYHLVLLMPPELAAAQASALPREVVFIIDTSGSMAGQSIVQAQEALTWALERLSPEERFNVIAFNSAAWRLFPAARPATADAVAEGQRFVRALNAARGTEMSLALDQALDGVADPARIRQVVFITDGSVGNEAALFSLIHDRLGDSRLFTVGIGSAPNSFFMREAAEIGRGSFTHIGSTDTVAERMSGLFTKLETPALTGIRMDWPDASAEAYPATIPDLYAGEPVVTTVRLPAGTTGPLSVTGMAGDQPWSAEASLAGASDAPGIAGLWARDRITELERRRYQGADPVETREQILEVALRHQIVSRYTSLVAIDDAVVRPPGAALDTQAVPTNMPEGVDMEMATADSYAPPPVPSGHAQLAPGANTLQPIDAIRAMAQSGAAAVGVQLPATATPAPLHLLIGATLLLMAVLFAADRHWAVRLRTGRPRR